MFQLSAFCIKTLVSAALILAAGKALADPAVVNIIPVDPDASEVGPKPAIFMVTREGGAVDKPLTVTFTLSGTATPGADYKEPERKLTFLPYAPMARIDIEPLTDTLAEGPETVDIKLDDNPEAYGFGEEGSTAEATIADAAGGRAADATPDVSQMLPPADAEATLTVDVIIEGKGHYENRRAGTHSDMTYHRELHYDMPLRGTYAPASGFPVIDKRDVPNNIPAADLRRFIMWVPRDALAGKGCGHGSAKIADKRSGLEIGDPGQPPLVPYLGTVEGGGPYPSNDPTVPQNLLCGVLAAFDLKKHAYHMHFEGTDTHVKVLNTHNGHSIPAYNLKLHGEGTADIKSEMTFFDVPMEGDGSTVAGGKTYREFNTVNGPENSRFPLSATIKWKIARS